MVWKCHLQGFLDLCNTLLNLGKCRLKVIWWFFEYYSELGDIIVLAYEIYNSRNRKE